MGYIYYEGKGSSACQDMRNFFSQHGITILLSLKTSLNYDNIHEDITRDYSQAPPPNKRFYVYDGDQCRYWHTSKICKDIIEDEFLPGN